MQGISSHSLVGFSQEKGQICIAQERAGKEAVLLTSIKSDAQSYALTCPSRWDVFFILRVFP